MRYLFADEIKYDIAQFTQNGMKIAQQMIRFAKPFNSPKIAKAIR